MPALPPVPQVIQLVARQLNDGQNVANVLHFGFTGGPPTPTDLANVGAHFITLWNGHMTALQGADQSLDTVEVVDLSGPGGASAISAGGAVGTLGGGPLPAQVALDIRKHVNVRYRGGHPRSSLMVGDDTKLQNTRLWDITFMNSVTSAYTAIVGGMNGFAAGAITVGGEVIVSYYSKAVNPVAPHRRTTPVLYAILGYEPRQALGTIRHRIGHP